VECLEGGALKTFTVRTIMGGLSEWKRKHVSARSGRNPASGTDGMIDHHRIRQAPCIVEASNHVLVASPFGLCLVGHQSLEDMALGCPESILYREGILSDLRCVFGVE
jgi:hypothetical protein